MRHFFFAFKKLVIGLLLLCVAETLNGATVSPAWAVSAPDKAPTITPHRAGYKMDLASAKNGSSVIDVEGHLDFEWNDMCDGWAIQQHMQMRFTYADGEEFDISSTELTWEAKDGKSYNFYIRRLIDGQESEVYRGKAAQNNDGSVSVSYVLPKGRTETLPKGTLFPSAHTLQILDRAQRGETLFSRNVFDGTDTDGISNISAFFLPKNAEQKEPLLKTSLKTNSLLNGRAWPVHLAFFKVGAETSEPDFEMDLNILPNGIARHMKIDYGDFLVTGTLEDIQPLRMQKCP